MIEIYIERNETIDDSLGIKLDYENLRDPFYQDDLILNFINLLDMYAVNKLGNKNAFADCIENVKDINIFMKFINFGEKLEERFYNSYLLSNPNRGKVINGDIMYNIYKNIFFVENNNLDFEKASNRNQINRLYMIFVSGCFTLADEAYTTIGPLEFVKFEKPIMEGDVDISCISLIEALGSNFSMILSHIVEYLEYGEKEANKFRGITDALAKYILRAFAIFNLKCLNIYSQKIPLINDISIIFAADKGSKYENKVNTIVNYVTKLKQINPQSKNKKDQYYDTFVAVYQDITVNNLLTCLIDLYIHIYKNMITNLNPLIFNNIMVKKIKEKRMVV